MSLLCQLLGLFLHHPHGSDPPSLGLLLLRGRLARAADDLEAAPKAELGLQGLQEHHAGVGPGGKAKIRPGVPRPLKSHIYGQTWESNSYF